MSEGGSIKSWLDELNELVDELAKRINMHRDRLGKSESTTRYALIDPLLSKIGWNLADPNQVLTEYTTESNKRLDYAMWSQKRVCLVVEAKALGKDLGDEEANQAIQYCYRTGCQHYVVTNGDRWEGYDLYAKGELSEKREFNFSVTERPTIMDIFWLWPGNFEGATAPPKLHQRQSNEPPSVAGHQAPLPQSPTLAVEGGTPLPEVEYRVGMGKPRGLVFPDGKTKDVSKSWTAVQPATVEWLVDTGRLRSLPLSNKRGTHLVNETPTRKDGSKFLHPRKVREGIWMDMNGAPPHHLRRAQEILEACGIDPNAVRLELG